MVLINDTVMTVFWFILGIINAMFNGLVLGYDRVSLAL